MGSSKVPSAAVVVSANSFCILAIDTNIGRLGGIIVGGPNGVAEGMYIGLSCAAAEVRAPTPKTFTFPRGFPFASTVRSSPNSNAPQLVDTAGYDERPDDGLTLVDCRIANAVRCVPPQNKPLPFEIATCRQFLGATFDDMPGLRAILMLGRVSHDSTLKTLGIRGTDAPFSHGAEFQHGQIRLFDSYHCSRYNTNTRRLTPAMFKSVFASMREYLAN